MCLKQISCFYFHISTGKHAVATDFLATLTLFVEIYTVYFLFQNQRICIRSITVCALRLNTE